MEIEGCEKGMVILMQNTKTEIVIVIDPGHGGKNEGGIFEQYVEKNLNMQVAFALKEELEKYDHVRVYLTHTEDIDMSLQERVDFAKSVNADFFASLHFNMSEYHTLYGTECWVSAFEDCYAKGNDFARIQNELLVELGLHNRGIKTRLNSSGIDYYGVIRAATEYGIPSCIIEHCHLDHAKDAGFVNFDSWLTTYGKVDATAFAKYYGLQSTELGVDYSGFTMNKTQMPTQTMGPDQTRPEDCIIHALTYDEDTNQMRIEVAAQEPDSLLCYYSYSLDGGETYSELQSWIGEEQMTIEIPMPYEYQGNLLVRVHNNYDLWTESQPVDFSYLYVEGNICQNEDTQPEAMQESNLQETTASTNAVLTFAQQELPVTKKQSLSLGEYLVFAVVLLVCMELSVVLFFWKRKRKK